MINSIRKKYEEYKNCRNIIMDHDEILLFYPDYYKTKVELDGRNGYIDKNGSEYWND